MPRDQPPDCNDDEHLFVCKRRIPKYLTIEFRHPQRCNGIIVCHKLFCCYFCGVYKISNDAIRNTDSCVGKGVEAPGQPQ